MKVCLCFNDLALYRKAIYKKIDAEYDCDWYIEDVDTKVKEFDSSELKNVYYLHDFKVGPFNFIKGFISLLRKKYDVYFVLGSTRNILLIPFCIIKKLFYPSKRIYYWTHGYYGKEGWVEMFFYKRPMFRLADGIFTYGEYARKLMIDDGFDSNKIFTIHNSLDYEHQLSLRNKIGVSDVYKKHFGNNHPNLFFVGRLTRVKKLDMALRAMKMLRESRQEYNMTFIGDGIVRDELEQLVKELKLENNAWFYGACYDEKLLGEMIYNADLCVAPGNIGLTAMHTLVFGTPAVTHNDFSYQMPEFEAIQEGETGTFFLRDSVDSLAEAISRWFDTKKDKREEVRKKCMQEIDQKWTPQFQIEVIKKHLK